MEVTPTALYVGGAFTQYRGIAGSASRLAKLDLTTGAFDTTFAPPASNGMDSAVLALASAGNSLYVGGSFTRYRTVLSASRLAKLDLTTGAFDSTFSPAGALNNGFDSDVQALKVLGTALYVGGKFSNYRNVANSASKLAKVDLMSGVLDTTFTSGRGSNGQVNSIATDGTSIYVGGSFSFYRGTRIGNPIKLDATSGVATRLAPAGHEQSGVDSTTNALSVSGTKLFVGGQFRGYGGFYAEGLARIDDQTAALDLSFAPRVESNGFGAGSVLALATAGTSLYVGGSFLRFRGDPLASTLVAKVDLRTGALDTTFSPPTIGAFNSDVTALATSGGALYVGGKFFGYRNVDDSANRIAKLDLLSGAIDTTFSPPGATANGFDATVNTLVPSGNSLFVGGEFATYRGAPAAKLVKLDAASGNLDVTFKPAAVTAALDAAHALAVLGSALYVGGVNGIGKVDTTTGNADSVFGGGAAVNSVRGQVDALLAFGGAVYIGGDFTSYRVAASNTSYIAKLDGATGALDPVFNSDPSSTSSNVTALGLQGSTLLLGGTFARYRKKYSPFAVAVNPATGVAP